MRSAFLLLALLLPLSGCALPRALDTAPPAGYGEYQPLHARILPGGGGARLAFSVNRPAYVALFMVVPGAGTSLIYPGFGTGSLSGRAFAGYTSLHSVRAMNVDQYHFAGFRGPTTVGPRFYFLIASDRPLNVERFGSFGMGLSRQLGVRFASINAYETMERLAELTVPHLADEEGWTTDLYVEWPDVLHSERANGLVPVRCNGYVMYTPVRYVIQVQNTICAPLDERRADEQGEKPVGTDSSEVAKPGSRKPLPPERATDVEPSILLLDRITASIQLQSLRDPQLGWTDGFDQPGRRGTPEMDGPRFGPGGSGGGGMRAAPRADGPSAPVERGGDARPEADRQPRMEPSAPRAEPRMEPARVDPSPPPAPSPPAPSPPPTPVTGCNPCRLP